MLEKYKETFSEERWNELCHLLAEKGMKVTFRDFTNSELMFIISETRLSENQRKGAIMYYVEGKRQNLIADELGYSKGTIDYHKRKISRLLKQTCVRVFK